MSLRQKLYQVLEHPENARSLNGLNTFLWILIILNILPLSWSLNQVLVGNMRRPSLFLKFSPLFVLPLSM